MIPRLLTLFALIALLGAGTWYVFREPPVEKLRRWRSSAAYHLEAGEVEAAEELSDRILELLPRSPRDLLFRARIEEEKGSVAGLERALELYDRAAELAGEAGTLIHLGRAAVLRRLGRNAEATALALSAMDAHPFEATMELGRIAMARMDARAARAEFEKALLDFSNGDRDRKIEARMALAGASELRLLVASSRRSEDDGPLRGRDPDPVLDELEAACRRELDRAAALIREAFERNRSADRYAPALAEVAARRQQVRLPGETPCLEAGNLLARKSDEASLATREARTFALHGGSLLLLALWNERDALPESGADAPGSLRARALDLLVRSLPSEGRERVRDGRSAGRHAASPDEGAGALEPPAPGDGTPKGSRRAARTYIDRLEVLARLFLRSDEFRALIDPRFDPELEAKLELHARMEEARLSAGREARRTFTLAQGVALLRAGDAGAARRIFEQHLARAGEDTRLAALDLAEAALRADPRSALVLEYLDRVAASSDRPLPAELLARKVRLLLGAQRSAPLAEEADRRLAEMLSADAARSDSPSRLLFLVQLRGRLEGLDAAIESARDARRRFPEDAGLRRLTAALLLERAGRAEGETATGDLSEAATLLYGEYLRDPVADPALNRRAEALARILSGRVPRDTTFEPAVRARYPGADPRSVERFSLVLETFFLGKHEETLAAIEKLPRADTFRPLLSYLEGVSHLELARGHEARGHEEARGGTGAAREAERHRQRAIESFRKDPGYLPNELELAWRRIVDPLHREEELPKALLRRLEELARAPEGSHHAAWILALALERRVRSAEEAERPGILRDLRSALREVIRKRPDFVPAYVALAETHLEGAAGRGGRRAGPGRRSPPGGYAKAIALLRAVPVPDEGVVERLVACLDASGRTPEAIPYLLALSLDRMTGRRLVELANVLLSTGALDEARRLLEATGSTDLGAEEERLRERLETALEAADPLSVARRLPALVSLLVEAERRRRQGGDREEGASLRKVALLIARRKSAALEHYEGLRHTLLGRLHSTLEERDHASSGDHRAAIVEHLEKALDYYDARSLEPPLDVLNNLAWRLSGSEDSGARRRALELSRRAVARVPSPETLPGVHDTYGWALRANGKLGESRDVFARLVEVTPDHAYARRYARVLLELGDREEAARQAEKALANAGSLEERRAALDLIAEIEKETSPAEAE